MLNHLRSGRNCLFPLMNSLASHLFTVDFDQERIVGQREKELELDYWQKILLTGTVPDRRLAVAKTIGNKPAAYIYRAKKLANLVTRKCMTQDYGSNNLLASDAAVVTRHARDAHVYFAKIFGNLLKKVLMFIAEVL